jgi:hypothetical protein
MDMTRNTPTFIDDLGDITLKLQGHTAELGTSKHGPAMVLPPHMCRCLAKELQMVAVEIERKAARDMCDNAAEVMKR